MRLGDCCFHSSSCLLAVFHEQNALGMVMQSHLCSLRLGVQASTCEPQKIHVCQPCEWEITPRLPEKGKNADIALSSAHEP